MADANLNLIYQRLHSAENYHPISAETFADWSMEAGDVVTVTREGTEYKSPVHSSTLKWYGKQQMTINSEGEEKREAITRASQKKYGRGGSAVRTAEFINKDIYSEDGHLHSSLRMTESEFHVYVEDKYSKLASGIRLTSSSMAIYVEDRYNKLASGIRATSSSMAIYVEDRYSKLASGIRLTSSSMSWYVRDEYSKLASGIRATSSSMAIYVEDEYNKLASGIRLTSSSLSLYARTVDIDAERVIISGNTKLNSIMAVTNSYVSITGNTRINGELMLSSLHMRGQSEDTTITADEFANVIKKAQKSADGSTLTLTSVDNSTLTFNKAVSLSGGWNSGVYTVSATAGSISGTAPSTTLFDLGLGTAAKGTGNTVEATYDIGYATVVGGQQRRGGSTGKTGTLSLNVGSLLQSKTASGNGTVTPDSGYLGLSSVVVDVSASPTWGTSGFAPNTSELPSGTKHQVDSLKTTIVNNRSNQGYVYFTITVSGTRHVYYFADNGNGWTS